MDFGGGQHAEQNKWMQMSRMLGREGANVWVLVALFKAVDQAVILFGSKMWVMTPHTGRSLGGGQNRLSFRLTVNKIRHIRYGSWYYPPWRNRCRRRGWRKWRSTCWRGRMRSYSILWRGQFWISVMRWFGGWGRKYIICGGNRRCWTYCTYLHISIMVGISEILHVHILPHS